MSQPPHIPHNRERELATKAIREFQVGKLTNISTHIGSQFQYDWAVIGSKPAAERARVIETLSKSAWATRHWRRMKPPHITTHWATYAAGEEPGSFDPGVRLNRKGTAAGPSEVSSDAELEDELRHHS